MYLNSVKGGIACTKLVNLTETYDVFKFKTSLFISEIYDTKRFNRNI